MINRLQLKFVVLFFLVVAVYVALFLLLRNMDRRQMGYLVEEALSTRNSIFNKILVLRGQSLETVAYDYTYWDEMVDFTRDPGSEFAVQNLDTSYDTYRFNEAYVFNSAFETIYSGVKGEEGIVKGFDAPFTKQEVAGFFQNDERFCHFFMETPRGITEFRGATIHPSADVDRKTTPQGYFFAGRQWNSELINDLSKLMNAHIELEPQKESLTALSNTTQYKDGIILISRVLPDSNGIPAFLLKARFELKYIKSFKEMSERQFVYMILFAFAAVGIVSIFIAYWVNKPLNRAIASLDQGNPALLDKLMRKNDEFGQLARTLRRFFEQKETLKVEVAERKLAEVKILEANAKLQQANRELVDAQTKLVQAAKMESVGRLAAGVAHEVKNPLAIILMGVDYLMKCLPSGEKSSLEVIKDIGLAAKRADTVVRGLLDFSASERLDSELQDLNKVIEISLMLVKHEMIKKRIFLSKDLASPLPLLKLDKSKIEQVFINIFMNAIQAMNDGGSLLVRTNLDKSHGAGQSWVVAEIEDSGCGISPDKLSKVFDPFYTTKPTGQGTGLGLSVSKKIVELHGGELRMSNRPEGGIRTKLMLPVR